MKDQKVNQATATQQQNEAISCGNCWGHQEWEHEIHDKSEISEEADNFIQKVVKKVIKE